MATYSGISDLNLEDTSWCSPPFGIIRNPGPSDAFSGEALICFAGSSLGMDMQPLAWTEAIIARISFPIIEGTAGPFSPLSLQTTLTQHL